MVNTRSSSGVDLPAQHCQRNCNPNPQQNQPPPMAGNNTVVGLQADQGANNNNNNNQRPRSKHQEFMTHRPPILSHFADPLEADDWFKTVE
ncbi:unnamed protein product [Urochloa humidicola]